MSLFHCDKYDVSNGLSMLQLSGAVMLAHAGTQKQHVDGDPCMLVADCPAGKSTLEPGAGGSSLCGGVLLVVNSAAPAPVHGKVATCIWRRARYCVS